MTRFKLHECVHSPTGPGGPLLVDTHDSLRQSQSRAGGTAPARKRVQLHNLALVFSFFATLALGACHTSPPVAIDGVMDLRSWDFDRDGSIELRGAWDFFWDQLISPDTLSAPTVVSNAHLQVPGYWRRQEQGNQSFSADGLATLRLRIRLPAKHPTLSLRSGQQNASYRLWANGVLLGQSGLSNLRQANAAKHWQTLVADIASPGQTLTLVMQIASYNSLRGGVENPLLLGAKTEITRTHFIWAVVDAALAGALLLFGLYYLLVFVLRRQARAPLFFALTCLLFGLRVPFWGLSGRGISIVSPSFPSYFSYVLDLVPFFWGTAFTLLFLHALYPAEALPWVKRLSLLAASLASLIALTGPSLVSDYVVTAYELLTLGYVPYGFWFLSLALRHKRQDAWIVLIGLGLFSFAGVNDILQDLQVFATLPLLPAGLFAFVLSDAAVLSLRTSRNFSTIEKLSQTLEAQNRELSRIDQLKDDFLARTSHELRTPLHGLIGISEALSEGAVGDVPAAAQRQLLLQQQSAQRLMRLVDNILDFSKLKHHDLELSLHSLDLRSLCEFVVEVLNPASEKSQHHLVNNVPASLPQVMADPDRLQQILFNLLGNAIKYASAGDIEIGAETSPDGVTMWVRDDGPGIEQKDQERIFEAFEQSISDPKGVGLGLTIAQQLVRLHGSRLALSSQVGQASQFYFTLPRAAETGIPQDPSAALHPEASLLTSEVQPTWPHDTALVADDNRPLILAVDDEAINLQVLQHQLGSRYRLRWAHTGTEALLAMQQTPQPDLVLLDLMLPELSGLEVCRRLRRQFDLVELPILALTAARGETNLLAAYDCGANDYITKPFSREELHARVHAQLKMREAAALQQQLRSSQDALVKEQKREHSAELRAEQESLEKLRYQLNPHLIFNALASVRGAIASDPTAARKMVGQLANFCSLTLRQGALETQSVGDEMCMVRSYLDIEAQRLGDYLEVHIDTDPAVETAFLPAFVLQPLVENATKYGRKTSPEKLLLKIIVSASDDNGLRLEVANTGRWIDSKDNSPSFGLGLSNLRQRLTRHYKDRFQLDILPQQGWVRVILTLPPLEQSEANPQSNQDAIPGTLS